MSVLTLRLAGPLQSWGSSSRFASRTTESAPTKSGVIGLLAAAQGRDRDADLSDLSALRFGVRVDQPGRLLRDFQTAHHLETGHALPISERFYLGDAVFVAAVEGPKRLLVALLDALRAPAHLPYLGRRSCPPAHPVDLRVREEDLEGALAAEPWQASAWHQRRHARQRRVSLEVVLEARFGEMAHAPAVETLRDQPLSFSPRHRRYALRTLRRDTVTVANPYADPPRHDPTQGLPAVEEVS